MKLLWILLGAALGYGIQEARVHQKKRKRDNERLEKLLREEAMAKATFPHPLRSVPTSRR